MHSLTGSSVNAPLSSDWICEDAVLRHFNICKKTLKAWHEKEGLPKYQLGRLTLYRETELNEFIEKKRKPTRSNPTASPRSNGQKAMNNRQ